MEPRVTKRDRKLYLSYELPHRIHCNQVCPTPAPNGSSIIVYGHQRGVKILWRAGRRRRSTPAQTNGASEKQDVMVIDASDDEQGDGPAKGHANEYEDEEPEQDPDSPYSGIIHDLDLELDSAALHLAIPAIPTLGAPALTRTHMLVAVACASGSVKLLSIPLAPPHDDDDAPSGLSQVDLPSLRQPARSLAAKILPLDEEQQTQTRSKNRGRKPEAEVLIATVSSALNVSAVDVTATAIRKRAAPTVSAVGLGSPACSVRFHPSRSSTQLLISDAAGVARIYDPHALESPDGQASGKWCMSYLAPYHGSTTSGPMLPRRKRILDSAWALSGRGVLVLLEDGEWGVWDTSGSGPSGKRVEDFAMSGFLGSTGEASEPPGSKKPSKLAPMTPNTRKAKSENLFGGNLKVAGAASTGGISISVTPGKPGNADESLVMLYGDDIYSIPSMRQLWQRSTTNSGNFGSLYAPGMAHIPDINLLNEKITSIQLLNGTQTSSFGQMNTQRYLVVSAEHRMIITETIKPPAPTRQLFQQAAERPVSRDRDQRMLDVGDLDLGGLNRMLDGRAEDARRRRVGFAT